MTSRVKDPRKSGVEPIEKFWPVYRKYEFGTNLAPEFSLERWEEDDEPVIARDHTWGFILPGGGMSEKDQNKSYLLSDLQIHEDLLMEYSEICDEESALEYVSKRGFPAGAGGMSLYNDVWPVNELIDSANYLGLLLRLAKGIQSEDTSSLNKYIKVSRSEEWSYRIDPRFKEKGLEMIVAVTIHDPEDINGDGYYFESKEYRPHRLEPLSVESPLLYNASVWKGYGAKKNIFAAGRYLQRALDRLLVGIQPTLDWGITTESEWILCETTKVITPWQAICFGLLRRVTGNSNVKSCKQCGKLVTGRKVFCSNTCTQGFNRNNDSRTNAYPEKRKRHRR